LKLKNSLNSDWFQFKNKDNLLEFHNRLKLVPASKKNYKENLNVKNKFIKNDILKYYFDFNKKKFKFIDHFKIQFFKTTLLLLLFYSSILFFVFF
jgi:hypothetical protein